jgi:hypothetical protein
VVVVAPAIDVVVTVLPGVVLLDDEVVAPGCVVLVLVVAPGCVVLVVVLVLGWLVVVLVVAPGSDVLVELLDDVDVVVGFVVVVDVLVLELVELLVDDVVAPGCDVVVGFVVVVDVLVLLDVLELVLELLDDVDVEVVVGIVVVVDVLVLELVELLVDVVVGFVVVVDVLVLELVELLVDVVVGFVVVVDVLLDVLEVVGPIEVVVGLVVVVEVLELVEVVVVLVVDVVVLVLVDVVVVVCWTSSDPMSQAGPLGRGKRRWSVEGQPPPVAMSIAGLPIAGRWFGVKPLLNRSAPSSGSVEFLSPEPAKPQVASFTMLKPVEVTVPEQFPPAAADRIVSCTVTVPPVRAIEPAVVATSLRIVTLLSVVVPAACRSAPPVVAVLPLNVLFVSVADARLWRPPPTPFCATLRLRVVARAFSVPAFSMPPPLVAVFVRIQTSVSVADPSLRSPPPAVAGPADAAVLCVISEPRMPAWNCSVAPAAL